MGLLQWLSFSFSTEPDLQARCTQQGLDGKEEKKEEEEDEEEEKKKSLPEMIAGHI